jgi:uncharacterized protein (DUF934 family)
MALIKDGRLASDRWHRYADEGPLQPDIPALVSLERFTAEREALIRAQADLGVQLEPGDDPAALAGDLDRIALVAIHFPSFTDGRGYSYARLLRERYGFKGEIRAVGHVLRDQYLFLARAGFDAFEVKDGETAEKWLDATRAITHAYQPATDARRPIWALRAEGEPVAAAAE